MAQKKMGSSLLKGIALTIGGGVALGVGIKLGQGALAQEPLGGEAGAGSALEPVLDRLSGIEGRIGQVESVLAEGANFPGAVPAEPLHHALGQFESRLSSQDSQMAALRTDLRAIEERNTERLTTFGESVDQLQSRLPGLVEESVGTTFQKMEEKLHREIEATHARTLETFVDNIQTKVVQRITAFEQDLAGQAEAMTQLREYSLKTDQNMQRLLVGVDRLASEIARKTDSHPPEPQIGEPRAPSPDPAPGGPAPEEARSANSVSEAKPALDPRLDPRAPEAASGKRPFGEGPAFVPNSFLEPPAEEQKPRSKWKVPAISAGAVAALGLLGWQSGIFSHGQPATPHAAQGTPPAGDMTAQASTPQATSQTPPADSSADSQAARIDAARALLQHREYAKAEEIYRSILKTDPQNREVVLALADVLYRQQKYEESAAVLKALSTRPRQ